MRAKTLSWGEDMKRFVVIGLGNFGAAVAETLYGLGNEVVAMDTDPERVEEVALHVANAVVGDGTDVRALRQVGAEEADGAVVSTGEDITASALTALMLRDLGVPEIYVKVISTDHARLIEKIGVTETIFPERDSGIRLGRRVSSSAILNFVPLARGFSLQEMAVPGAWVGRTLRDLELPRKWGISVVGLRDVLHDEIRSLPDPDRPLMESDTLLVAGADERLAEAARVR